MSARSRQITYSLGGAVIRGGVDARFGVSSRSQRRAAFAMQTRVAMQDLGPAFIKLGQLVSVRPDVFPPEWVFEMEALRDRVPPLPAETIRRVIRQDFGREPEELFSTFEDEPLASASISQVHLATLGDSYRPVIGETLPEGARLAVKVVRPGGEESILADIAEARRVVSRADRIGSLRRYNLPGLLEEFAATLCSECDLRNEAAVADRFAFDFRDDPMITVPRVVWPRTSRRVLTTEYIEGWPLSELDEAARAGIDGHGLALHGAQAFLRQVLEHGRYHADLHPSNLLVTADSRIAYLDFGIAGTTTAAERAAIAQVLVATVYGDADRALRYSAELGLVVPPEKQARVRERVASLMGRTLRESPRDVKGFAIGFLGIMADEDVPIPAGYGLLVKALVTVEGVARALYPDIDIVEAARPFVTGLVARELLAPERIAERMPDALRAGLREIVR